MTQTLADLITRLEGACACVGGERKDDEIETISIGGLRQILTALREREKMREAVIEAAFQFFTRKYVQRSDARQQAMGLQYTEAETHDLAKETAHLFLSLLNGDRSPPTPAKQEGPDQ
jgi:hypothetical protein